MKNYFKAELSAKVTYFPSRNSMSTDRPALENRHSFGYFVDSWDSVMMLVFFGFTLQENKVSSALFFAIPQCAVSV